MQRRKFNKSLVAGAAALATGSLPVLAQEAPIKNYIECSRKPIPSEQPDPVFIYNYFGNNLAWEVFYSAKEQLDFSVENGSLIVYHNGKECEMFNPIGNIPHLRGLHFIPQSDFRFIRCWQNKNNWLFSLRIV